MEQMQQSGHRYCRIYDAWLSKAAHCRMNAAGGRTAVLQLRNTGAARTPFHAHLAEQHDLLAGALFEAVQQPVQQLDGGVGVVVAAILRRQVRLAARREHQACVQSRWEAEGASPTGGGVCMWLQCKRRRHCDAMAALQQLVRQLSCWCPDCMSMLQC